MSYSLLRGRAAPLGTVLRCLARQGRRCRVPDVLVRPAFVAAEEVVLRRTTQASARRPVSAHGAAASRAHRRGGAWAYRAVLGERGVREREIR